MNVGIIGKGKLVKHLLENLAEYCTASEELSGFISALNVAFYCEGYRKDNAEEQIEHLREAVKNAHAGSCGSLDERMRTETDFRSFFLSSDVIIDASAGYIPGKLPPNPSSPHPAGKPRTGSLYDFAFSIIQKTGFDEGSLDSGKDYDSYKTECERKQKEPLGRDGFFAHWNGSYSLLKALRDLRKLPKNNPGYVPVGERTTLAFPFSYPMMKQRGEIIKKIIDSPPKSSRLPTYINLVNEPCLTSAVLTAECPEMVPYTVACTGYDLMRMEQAVNKNEKVLQACRKAGLPEESSPEKSSIRLRGIRGWHERSMMVPDLIPDDEPGRRNLEAVLTNFNITDFYNFTRGAVENYAGLSMSPGRDINKEVDVSILQTVISAAHSRGKALSLQPPLPDAYGGRERSRPLCNGYFHQIFNDGSGLFLVGNHRFRNGKVEPEER